MVKGDEGVFEVAAGQSRSGKTYIAAKRIAKQKNVLVWDVKGEFGKKFRCRPVSRAELAKIATGAPGRYSFTAPATPDHFDFFCRCAWLWLRSHATKNSRVCLLVDELADVTSPGKAPQAWGEIIRKGLEHDPYILALTQSPHESDKTSLRNATIVRCHSLAWPNDRKTMAQFLDVHIDQVKALNFDRKEFLERDLRTQSLTIAGKGLKPKPV